MVSEPWHAAARTVRVVVEHDIPVRFEGCEADAIDAERLRAARRELAARVLSTDGLELVIAYDPRGAAAKLVGEAAGEPVYETGGMAVWHQDGMSVILPALQYLIGFDADAAALAHVAAHESHHVLIGQRGERLVAPDLLDEGLPIHDQTLDSIARTIVEEFRVERGIYEEGHPLPPRPHHEMLEGELEVAAEIVAEETDRVRERLGKPDLARAVGAVEAVLRRVAHVAAADVATGGQLRPAGRSTVWEQRVGHRYDRLRDDLHRVPSSLDRVSLDQLRAVAAELRPGVADWMETFWIRLGTRYDGTLGVVNCRPL